MKYKYQVEKEYRQTAMSTWHLKDSRLSLEAKGLLSWLLSEPEGWDGTLEGITQASKTSLQEVEAAMDELWEAGYITSMSLERHDEGRCMLLPYTIWRSKSD